VDRISRRVENSSINNPELEAGGRYTTTIVIRDELTVRATARYSKVYYIKNSVYYIKNSVHYIKNVVYHTKKFVILH
jgi:hypothetical protein